MWLFVCILCISLLSNQITPLIIQFTVYLPSVQSDHSSDQPKASRRRGKKPPEETVPPETAASEPEAIVTDPPPPGESEDSSSRISLEPHEIHRTDSQEQNGRPIVSVLSGGQVSPGSQMSPEVAKDQMLIVASISELEKATKIETMEQLLPDHVTSDTIPPSISKSTNQDTAAKGRRRKHKNPPSLETPGATATKRPRGRPKGSSGKAKREPQQPQSCKLLASL